jgi:hypothetical protein
VREALAASKNCQRRQPKLALIWPRCMKSQRDPSPSLSGLLLDHEAACEEHLRNRIKACGYERGRKVLGFTAGWGSSIQLFCLDAGSV